MNSDNKNATGGTTVGDIPKSDNWKRLSVIEEPNLLQDSSAHSFTEDVSSDVSKIVFRHSNYSLFGEEKAREASVKSSIKREPFFMNLNNKSAPSFTREKQYVTKKQKLDDPKGYSLPTILSKDAAPLFDVSNDPKKDDTVVECSENFSAAEQPLPYTVFNYKLIVFCIAFIASMGPLAGNIYIPAIPLLQRNLNLSRETMDGSISIFMAVFCVFPLVWGVLCDRFGRKIILLLGLCLSVLSNTLLTRLGQLSSKNIMAQLFCYRVIQGIAASCFISCGCGMVRDLIDIKQRATYMGYFFLGPNIAPIIAPILAGIILSVDSSAAGDSTVHWRWLFLTLVILNSVGILITVFLLPETCRSLVGNGDPRWAIGMKDASALTPEELACLNQTKYKIYFGGLSQPISSDARFANLYEKPPKITLKNYINVWKKKHILLVSISVGLQFALYYAFAVTLSHGLRDIYGFSNMGMAAGYVVPGAGLVIGTLTSGHISDMFLSKWVKQQKTVYPEKRLFFQLLGIYIGCVGGIMYGWLLEFRLSTSGIFISSFLIGLGLTWSTNSSTTYASQIAKAQTGTAVSMMNAIRNAGAAISSALAYTLINKMGYGWFFTGMSFLICLSTGTVLFAIRDGYKKIARIDEKNKENDGITVSLASVSSNYSGNKSLKDGINELIPSLDESPKREAVSQTSLQYSSDDLV